MDDIDHSNERVQRDLERRISSIRGGMAVAREPDEEVLCVDCDNPIPPKRIAAMPSATRCIKCQSRSER
jgi:phage/conjugal plasmid C-4 type zinc finger TraR family protein